MHPPFLDSDTGTSCKGKDNTKASRTKGGQSGTININKTDGADYQGSKGNTDDGQGKCRKDMECPG